MNRLTRATTMAVTVVAVALTSALAAQDNNKKANEPKGVAGTWNIELMSHQVALVLEQEGTKVTGTMMMMGNDLPLKGDFVDGKLTLVGDRSASTTEPDHDRGGGAPRHGEGHPEPKPITATLMEDGTLQGEMQTNRGPVKWTGERLKKRK